LSNNNIQVKASAEEIFQALSEDLDVTFIVPHITHGRNKKIILIDKVFNMAL